MPSLPPGRVTLKLRITRRHCLLCACLLGIALSAAHSATASPPASRTTIAPAAVTVTGQVEDRTGAIIPGARVALRRANGTIVASTVTDSAGTFRLSQPPPGEYKLAIVVAGFTPVTRALRIDAMPVPPLTLMLDLASVSTSVNVNAGTEIDPAAPDRNGDAAVISADEMKSIPVFDGDIVATLSALLDAGASGEGGPTLIVDGVEMKSLGVAASAIDRVSINQDPYSALYHNPGRGQVEIVTKSTADSFHGSASITYRNAALNASNYFSPVKPPDRRLIFEGFLTGPIRPLHNTAFLFSLTRAQDDTANTVAATIVDPAQPASPTGIVFTQNVPTPTRATRLTMKVNRQYNDHHSGFINYRYLGSRNTDRNVGGLTLPSAGQVTDNYDQDITYHDDLILGANRLNQFNLLFEHNIDTDTSDQQAPALVVQGAFTGGGAQADTLQTENNPNLQDVFSWTPHWQHGTHQLKFGVQLPNMGRRILEDHTNRLGTYTFASLAAYQAGTPLTFSVQQGQSRFLTYYLQPSAFFQDLYQATPRLSISAGLRYDWQNTLPGTVDGVQPRLSLAYLLDKPHAMVLRVGGGIYIRRVGVNIGRQLVQYEHAAERSLLLTSVPCYPCNPATFAAQPPSLFQFEPNVHAPEQGYFGASLERQMLKKASLTLTYNGYRGWHALRSIDVNAPLPPFTSAVRPNAAYAQVLQLGSGGYQKSDSAIVNFRGRVGPAFSGFLQYTYSHSDSNTTYSTFIPQNQYRPNDEWSRADNDQRHRLALFGTFLPDKPLNLGLGFFEDSAGPYTETTGTDDFHTGLVNARPAGVPRNSLDGGDYTDLQLRLGYTRKLHPNLKDLSPAIALSLSSFNTLNHPSFGNYVGVVTSPRFMQPTTASAPRQLQFAVSYTF
jgi:hypothetical protein